MENSRRIAILTDAHGLLEPTLAVLNDIDNRGIKEVYSLGDNIGVGPNPGEVIDLLEERGVKSIAGNAEEYVRLGLGSFPYILNNALRKKSQLWTLSKLNEHQKGIISLYPHSIELLVGGKNIALCHFANDIRFDFQNGHDVNTYIKNIQKYGSGYQQFLYTNSEEQREKIEQVIREHSNSPYIDGYLSAQKNPLFDGKMVNFFDAVIQGHVHWKIYEPASVSFYSIRAVGMGYSNSEVKNASYVILTETETGFNLDEVLVGFDEEKMLYSILNSDNPDDRIYRYEGINKSR